MFKLAIIGCGHWGPNYARIFHGFEDAAVTAVCDIDREKLRRIEHNFPGKKLVNDYHEILDDAGIDAVIISTPASTHYKITKEAVSRGKHILVEKPLALKVAEAEEIVRLADGKGAILMVGHTFLYNQGIRKVKQYIEDGTVGDIYYLHATRTHLGLIREDVNAIWDLAPHDVSIFNYLIGTLPETVSATSSSFLSSRRQDVAFINLSYPGNIIANIHVSWIDSNKVREIQVIGSKARVVFNDLDNLERVRIYQKGIMRDKTYNDYGEFQFILRDGDIISPRIDFFEPLKTQCQHFLECLRERKRPFTDGVNGLDNIRVMDAIERSILKNGSPEKVLR